MRVQTVCDADRMNARQEVVDAAEARAAALGRGDADALAGLLHRDFRWTSHTGDRFDRDAYVARNTQGPVRWQSQRLRDVEVTVVGETAVLHAEVTDVVGPDGDAETFTMPMTQVWVRCGPSWRCLAGHAGPRLRLVRTLVDSHS